MKILSLITHPHTIPNTDIQIFWWKLYDPSIDSNLITTFKAQKGSKDIVKIVHVTTVVQP